MGLVSNTAARLLAILIAGLLLSACEDAMDTMVRTIADDEAIALSDLTVDTLLARDDAGLRTLLHSEAAPLFTDETLAQMFDYLPADPPSSQTALRANWSTVGLGGNGSERRFDIIYRLDFSGPESEAGRKEFIKVGLFAQGDAPLQLVELRVFPAPAPIYSNPGEWPAGFWIGLVLTPATALFCLAALVSVWRTPRVKRRIWWSLFIVFIGYPIFGFSTQTGGWGLVAPDVTENGGLHFQLFQFALMSASWMHEPLTGHHVFHVAVPVGALLFFVQKTRGRLALKAQKGEQNTDDTPPDAGPPHPPSNPVSP
ncbi:hypothetical protein ACWCOP_03490 [Maricaulaceae bacterium MS644]